MRVKFWSENPAGVLDTDGTLVLMYLVVTECPVDWINLAQDGAVVNTVVNRWFS